MLGVADLWLQLRALWARAASYLKKDWTIDNYPILVRSQPTSETAHNSRLQPVPWSASIVNWPGPSGCGISISEALADLRKNFEEFKLTNKLPRPGTKVRVQFSSAKRTDSHRALADDFIHRVLELDWAWISDDSTLFDFHTNETNDHLFGRIRSIYGVDVSDVFSGNLAEILDRISAHSRPIQ